MLVLALPAAAGAVGNGRYFGKSDLKVSGSSVLHPFGLTVSHGKVTGVSLFAGSSCADLNGTAGISVNFKIKHNRFTGTMNFARFALKFRGAFKAKMVTGSFAGTAKGLSGSCPVPKNTFKATR